MSEVAEIVDKTLEDLPQAIQRVGVDEDFPHILDDEQLNEMHVTAIFLSATVVDSLRDLIG